MIYFLYNNIMSGSKPQLISVGTLTKILEDNFLPSNIIDVNNKNIEIYYQYILDNRVYLFISMILIIVIRFKFKNNSKY